jgi:hypothetical protein
MKKAILVSSAAFFLVGLVCIESSNFWDAYGRREVELGKQFRASDEAQKKGLRSPCLIH